MNKKNSITQFKKPSAGILPTVDAKPSAAAPASPAAKKRGAKPKRAADKRSHRVMLALTDSEREKLAEKRGLANEATFIYAFLHDNGLFK